MALQPPPLHVPIINDRGEMPDVWRTYLLSLGTILSGLAPDDARYWVGESNTFLSSAMDMGSLSSGYVKVTVAAGVGTPSSVSVIPAADISGTLGVAHGGTGAATLTAHGVLIGNGTGVVSVSGTGSSGEVLTSNGAAADPTFQSPAAAAAGTLTGTTLASNVVTSSLTAVGTVTSGTWSASFGVVSGANLTNLTAANLSGTITSSVQDNITRVGTVTSGTWSGAFGTVSGANLTNLTAANLSGTITSSVQDNITRLGTIVSGVWSAGAVTSSGKIITSDTTDATSVSTGAIQSAGGLGVAKAIYVGTFANINTTRTGYQVQIDAPIETTRTGLSIKSTEASTGGDYMDFVNSAGSTAGHVSHNGTTTVSYVTSSDRRLKRSLGVATSVDVLRETVVHDFEWIVDGIRARGVFAQDEEKRAPFAAISKPRAGHIHKMDATGSPLHPWGVDYSKYVPDLLVGWKNHEARLQAAGL